MKTYIIIGGLGGVGLELTDWMIQKGATKIILNSSRGLRNGYQSLCLKKWQTFGVTVKISIHDSTEVAEAERLMLMAKKLGPIGGMN